MDFLLKRCLEMEKIIREEEARARELGAGEGNNNLGQGGGDEGDHEE